VVLLGIEIASDILEDAKPKKALRNKESKIINMD
jgi:hypothetical protein